MRSALRWLLAYRSNKHERFSTLWVNVLLDYFTKTADSHPAIDESTPHDPEQNLPKKAVFTITLVDCVNNSEAIIILAFLKTHRE